MDPEILQTIVERVATRWRDPDYRPRARATDATLSLGNRFTYEAITFAVNQQVHQLKAGILRGWAGLTYVANPRRIVVTNPGNVPFAELQDFLGIVLLGHRYVGKLSTRSPYLLTAFADDLLAHGAMFHADMSTELPALDKDDALIASGFDDTVERLRREALDAGIPAGRILVRGAHYSAAVIGAGETTSIMERLAEDILLHEGQGCRNVAIVWAPSGESPDALLQAMASFRAVFPPHPETAGSLKMQIAYYRAAGLPFAHADDDSFLVSRGEAESQRPGHLRWTEYNDIHEVRGWIGQHGAQLQLVVAASGIASILGSCGVPIVEPGEAQRPPLGWEHEVPNLIDFLRSIGD